MARGSCLTRALVAGILLAAVGPAYGHVRLIVPNGGEQLDVGSVFTIQWTIVIQHNQLNWDLWYSTTGPTGPWTPIVMNLTPGSPSVGSVHTYNWIVPNDPDPSVWVRVRMDNSGTDYYDVSNGSFAIRAPCACLGDMNSDGKRDGADISAFVGCVIQGGSCACADVNGMNGVTFADVAVFVADLLTGTACP